MWWRGEDDAWVSELVFRLLDAWLELPFVNVIGSTWTRDRQRTVFVGVDPALDPRPRAWAPGERGIDALARRLIQRFGPLPYPVEPRVDLGPEKRAGEDFFEIPPGAANAIRVLFAIHRRAFRVDPFSLVMVPLDAADRVTRSELGRFRLPPETQIGYVGPIRPVGARRKAVHREAGGRATIGCGVRAAGGTFLTTVGHLGASEGELVYAARPSPLAMQRPRWGRISAATSPDSPDGSAEPGLDLAIIEIDRDVPLRGWGPVDRGDPSQIGRAEYVSWTGAETGLHEAEVTVTAAAVRAMGTQVPYRHALMVTGRPPAFAGRDGDSGSAVYDSERRLLGHFVATEGGRTRGGAAPNGWFQMIDLAHDFVERRCGQVDTYLAEPPDRP